MRRGAALLLLLALPLGGVRPAAAGGDDPDREFRRRVDAAITKGCEHLAGVQKPDGTWDSAYEQSYPGGTTTLCLLALLLSEYNIWSDAVVNGLRYVLAQRFDRTYSAALAMMCVEARAIPPEEWKAIREGRPVKKPVRKLPAEHKAFLEAHRDMLLSGRLHDAWGYPKGPDFSSDWPGDLSNTQYAVLALQAASRCGIDVEEDDWMTILRIVLAAQEKDGPNVKLVVDRSVDKHGYTSVETRPAKARGWQYQWPVSVKSGRSTATMNPGPDDKPSGSMTTAGISCLAIVHSELLRSRKYQGKVRDVASAIDDGFAWLQEYFSVDTNPGGNPGWHYYYLYGLERAGVLADRKWIGEHDWYREGAEFLLARQAGNGSWGDVLQTSFALLFLKRSTLPVATTGLDGR